MSYGYGNHGEADRDLPPVPENLRHTQAWRVCVVCGNVTTRDYRDHSGGCEFCDDVEPRPGQGRTTKSLSKSGDAVLYVIGILLGLGAFVALWILTD